MSFPLNNPAGAAIAVLRFRLSDAGNDWWWAIDNIEVRIERDPPGPAVGAVVVASDLVNVTRRDFGSGASSTFPAQLNATIIGLFSDQFLTVGMVTLAGESSLIVQVFVIMQQNQGGALVLQGSSLEIGTGVFALRRVLLNIQDVNGQLRFLSQFCDSGSCTGELEYATLAGVLSLIRLE